VSGCQSVGRLENAMGYEVQIGEGSGGNVGLHGWKMNGRREKISLPEIDVGFAITCARRARVE
jgi:hypothetical protein